MAATPHDYPQSYEQAERLLSGRQSRTLSGTATELYRAGSEIRLRYHATDVVTFRPDGSIELNTGGWHTPTTARKMNACLGNGYRVASKEYYLYLFHKGTLYSPLTPSLLITSDGDVVLPRG